MKTIIILLMIFGLNACDESTVTQPKDDTKVETQKYTLEEILADPNWVEITDTLHYEDINGFTYLTNNWKPIELILINRIEDYNKIKSLSDTTYEWYRANNLKYDIDFKKHTLIGLRAHTPLVKYNRQIFKNEVIKQYHYSVSIISPFIEIRVARHSFNFLLIPKINTSYKFSADTLQVWEN